MRVPHLAPLASRLVAWDGPGHGTAPGACSLGPVEQASLELLAERLRADSPSTPLVLCGWSLGAGVAIQAEAQTASFAAVIAESPYCHAATPARNVLAARGLPHRLTLPVALWLVGLPHRRYFRAFDRAVWARRLVHPLLVIHGSADTVSPPEDGRVIAGCAGGADARLCLIEDAGHNDLWTNPRFAEQAVAAVRTLVASLATAPRPA